VAQANITPWVGVDLDGTLAHYDHAYSPLVIGPPVPAMLARVKAIIASGMQVRIMTARAYYDTSSPLEAAFNRKVRKNIEDWAEKHVGVRLPVTCVKDYGMVALYDDRAKQVVENTGILVEELLTEARRIDAVDEMCDDLIETALLNGPAPARTLSTTGVDCENRINDALDRAREPQ
jgi:hypothetical protein